MNKTNIALMFAGLLAMTALAGCASSQQENQLEEKSGEMSQYPVGCDSYSGFSPETGESCTQTEAAEVPSGIWNAATRGDKLMPVPDGAEGYGFGSPMEANEETGWITPVPGTWFNVNSAGKPFWVCTEAIPDSGIAGWCNHYFDFSFNAFQGWRWQEVGQGDQRIQLRVDWDDTVLYMTNVPIPPQGHCCKG